MRFTLSTDKGVFVSVPAETLTKLMEYMFVSGNLLQYLEREKFEDKVLEGLVQFNVNCYTDLYHHLENEKKKPIKEKVDIKPEPVVEEIIEEIPLADNVIRFPFGKKD